MKFLLARPFSKRGSLLLPRITQESFLGRDLGGAGGIGAKNEEEELLPPKKCPFYSNSHSPTFLHIFVGKEEEEGAKLRRIFRGKGRVLRQASSF